MVSFVAKSYRRCGVNRNPFCRVKDGHFSPDKGRCVNTRLCTSLLCTSTTRRYHSQWMVALLVDSRSRNRPGAGGVGSSVAMVCKVSFRQSCVVTSECIRPYHKNIRAYRFTIPANIEITCDANYPNLRRATNVVDRPGEACEIWPELRRMRTIGVCERRPVLPAPVSRNG